MVNRLVILALAVFVMNPLFAQDSVKAYLKTGDLEKLEKAVSKMDKTGRGWDNYQELVPHFHSGFAHFFDYKQISETEMKADKEYSVRIIAYDSKIFFWTLIETQNSKTTTDGSVDKQLLEEFKNKFYAAYKRPLNMQDLFEWQSAFSDGSCGDGGGPTKEWKRIMTKVNEKDTSFLKTQLSSSSTYKQVYAAAGLILLQKKGMKLDQETKDILDVMASRTDSIWVCRGCLGDPFKISDIIRELKESKRN